MKQEKRLWLVLGIFLVVLLPFSLADKEVTYNELCSYFSLTSEQCSTFDTKILCSYIIDKKLAEAYYQAETNKCFFVERAAAPAAITSTASVPVAAQTTQPAVVSAATSTSYLEERLANLEWKISSLESSYNSLIQQFNEINSKQGMINTQMNTVATGLAGLQTEINSTKSSVQRVETNLSLGKGFVRFLVYLFLVALIAGIALAVIYYVTKKEGKKEESRDTEVLDYVARGIKQGKSFPQLKASLIRTGWSEGMVNWAYHRVTKGDYAKEQRLPRKEMKTADSKKVMVIVGLCVLLLGGMLFLLTGTSVGKAVAIQYKPDREIEITCTPPQIKTPGGFSCCTDMNNNGVCDVDESYEQERPATESFAVCLGDQDCAAGKRCINKKCSYLSELGGVGCRIKCVPVSAEILTSDGESYNVIVGRGSYTAAGGLDWTLLSSPEYCSAEEVRLPIEIVKKRSLIGEGGKTEIKVIGKEVITLKRGETSSILKHLAVPSLSFSLTVKDINVRCN